MSKRKTVRFVEDVAPTDKTLLRMSKRRRDGNDNGNEGDGDSAYYEIGRKLEPRPGEKQNFGDSKHTLDSDEEEEEKYDRLNVADVEGKDCQVLGGPCFEKGDGFQRTQDSFRDSVGLPEWMRMVPTRPKPPCRP